LYSFSQFICIHSTVQGCAIVPKHSVPPGGEVGAIQTPMPGQNAGIFRGTGGGGIAGGSKYSNLREAGHTSPAVQTGISASRSARPAFGKAVASGTMHHGVPMRDLVGDWKKWNRAERVLAVMGTLLMVALPIGLLMTG
jgi:hypothetical protein